MCKKKMEVNFYSKSTSFLCKGENIPFEFWQILGALKTKSYFKYTYIYIYNCFLVICNPFIHVCVAHKLLQIQTAQSHPKGIYKHVLTIRYHLIVQSERMLVFLYKIIKINHSVRVEWEMQNGQNKRTWSEKKSNYHYAAIFRKYFALPGSKLCV